MYVNIYTLIIEKDISLRKLSEQVGCNYSSLRKLAQNQTKSMHLSGLWSRRGFNY